MVSPHACTVQDKVEWYLRYDTKKRGTDHMLALSLHAMFWYGTPKKKKKIQIS